jgi:prephenate dehydrogenase
VPGFCEEAAVSDSECLGVVGVGLMGGSVGLAARRSARFSLILGYDVRGDVLRRAVSNGCIDEPCPNLEQLARRSSMVVIATPVHRIADYVLQVVQHIVPGSVITDTGSTKAELVQTVESAVPRETLFVGSHPLCGSEKHGPDAARANLFDNQLVLLTPTKKTRVLAVERVQQFWQSLGARTHLIPPDEHDRILAMTSHLPHLLASCLAGLLSRDVRPFVSSGFRDTTRLASGDPEVWSAIFTTNASNLLSVIKQFRAQLDEFQSALENRDSAGLARLLAAAKGIRDDLGN